MTAVFTLGDKTKRSFDMCPECREKKCIDAAKLRAEEKLTLALSEGRSEWYESSGVTMGLKTFDNFNRSLQLKAFETVKNLAWHPRDPEAPKPNSLVLLSPNLYGVGKSHLACALANFIIETEQPAWIREGSFHNFSVLRRVKPPVRMFQEIALLRRIRATFNEGATETEEQIYSLLNEDGLLIIDDVGKLKPRDTSFLQGVWYNIIDSRYMAGQSVLITTNLNATELENHIGGAVADRLREMCGKKGFIVMSGTSYRRS